MKLLNPNQGRIVPTKLDGEQQESDESKICPGESQAAENDFACVYKGKECQAAFWPQTPPCEPAGSSLVLGAVLLGSEEAGTGQAGQWPSI